MRVLHVTECHEGGVSRAIRAMVELSPQHEHHLLFVGSDEPDPGLFHSTTSLPNGLLSRIRAVRRSVAELQPAGVIAHSSWAGAYSRLGVRSVPIAYEPHCFVFDDPFRSTVNRAAFRTAERMLARNTHRFVVLSAHEARLARNLGGDAEILMLPNVATITAGRPLTAPAATRPVVAMVGRITAQKDPTWFRDVMAASAALGLDATWRWIGDGDDPARSELVSSGVEVTGWLQGPELVDKLGSADVYLHSAAYEGFPLSVLDAAALRVPIVARAIPCFDDTGLLTAATPADAARLVQDIVNRPTTRSEAVERGDALSRTMSSEAQQAALTQLWESFNPPGSSAPKEQH